MEAREVNDYLRIAACVLLWFVPWDSIPLIPRIIALVIVIVFLLQGVRESIAQIKADWQSHDDFSFIDTHDIALAFGLFALLWILWVIARGMS